MARKIIKDDVWDRIKHFFEQKGRGRRGKSDRDFVEAILWMMRTGTAWRDLDSGLGPWKTHYNRFNNWAKSGRLDRLLDCLKKKTRIMSTIQLMRR